MKESTNMKRLAILLLGLLTVGCTNPFATTEKKEYSMAGTWMLLRKDAYGVSVTERLVISDNNGKLDGQLYSGKLVYTVSGERSTEVFQVNLEVTDMPIYYEGRVSDDGKSVSGRLFYGDGIFPYTGVKQ